MNPHVYPGQRVIARDGRTHIVAFTDARGRVYAYGARGIPVPIRVVCDAWGGEPELPLCDSRGEPDGVRGPTAPGPARRGHLTPVPRRDLPRAA
jgi:hypothetical protein